MEPAGQPARYGLKALIALTAAIAVGMGVAMHWAALGGLIVVLALIWFLLFVGGGPRTRIALRSVVCCLAMLVCGLLIAPLVGKPDSPANALILLWWPLNLAAVLVLAFGLGFTNRELMAGLATIGAVVVLGCVTLGLQMSGVRSSGATTGMLIGISLVLFVTPYLLGVGVTIMVRRVKRFETSPTEDRWYNY